MMKVSLISRRPSAGTVSGSILKRCPEMVMMSDTSRSFFVKFRSVVCTSTLAGPPTRRSRGSAVTCSTSTVSTRLM